MITGQNTEIEHASVAFHVQTEDKGRGNPQIVSLIYVGGRVLAAKRTSYAELLAKGSEEKDISELMDKQHRTMIAAIRHGRFDAHVKKLLQADDADRPPVPPDRAGDTALIDLGQSLDEMVSQYLGAEVPERLVVDLDGARALRAGEQGEVVLTATAEPGGRRIEGAQVEVEMISTVSRPQLLASGVTGEDGRCRLLLSVPELGGGMAAVIVSVRCDLGESEEKILL